MPDRCATCGEPLTERGFFLFVPGVRGTFHSVDCALDALRRQEHQTVTAEALQDELLKRARAVRGEAV